MLKHNSLSLLETYNTESGLNFSTQKVHEAAVFLSNLFEFDSNY